MCSCERREHFNISLNSDQSDILRQQTRNLKFKKYCFALLEMFGSLRYMRHIFEELDAEARSEVDKHAGKPMLEDILDKMLEWKRWTEQASGVSVFFCHKECQ